ncbi:MAG: EAL domain-containing protein [Solirubrobacteraceae bacterium]
MPVSRLQVGAPLEAVPIESNEHIVRARKTAARTRIAVGLIGIWLIALHPQMTPHPVLGALGFATIVLTALAHVQTRRSSWMKVEESLAGAAAVLIVGMGVEQVTALTLLWLTAVASGVMARGGRVHWLGSAVVIGALALPIVRWQQLSGGYAAMCVAVPGLLLTCGRLTRELNYLLRQASRQAENAETLLLAGDIAARMSQRSESPAMSEPLAAHAERSCLSAAEQQSAREALAGLIRGEGLKMVVQPIVDIRTCTAHAYEALARFGRPRENNSPLHWFALAEELGERPALERACLREGLLLLAERPPGTSVSLNLSAPVLLEQETMTMLRDAGDGLADGLSGLIIEITEETLVHSDLELANAIAPLRARGARLAVDDMGAGYSGLRQITTVLPSYLKLDRSLVTDIDSDPDRAALVGALAGYAKQVGSLLVAEGVETEAELNAIRRLGVPLVQGFYFSRPAPPWPEISTGSSTQSAARAPAAHLAEGRAAGALAVTGAPVAIDGVATPAAAGALHPAA